MSGSGRGRVELAGRAERGRFVLDVALTVEAGTVLALVGPNGAGKSTLVGAVAGLVPLTSGRLALGGDTVDDPVADVWVPPHRRSIGLAAQDLALFPHLSALDNVAFGCRARGARAAAARATAEQWLGRLGLGPAEAERRPTALSGGQAQRVSLARALATDPALLVLDEPLSAVDAGARPDLRADLATVLADHAAGGGSAIVVTHDPVEAAALAAEVVVIEGGRIVQRGSPDDLARRPGSAYVADLLGVNLLRGRATGSTVALDGGGQLALAEPVAIDGRVVAVVHPRAISLHLVRPSGTPRNTWSGVVAGLDPDPGGQRLRVRMAGEVNLVAEITAAAAAELELRSGVTIWATAKATDVAAHPD